MAGIEGIGRSAATRIGVRGPARAAGGFAVPTEAASAGQRAVEAAPAASLSSMLTLQEAGGETVEDREARRHGHDLLAALAVLQRALLGAGDDAAALRHLAGLAAAMPQATDPRLAAMVSAIMLRVRVELARRGL